VDETTLPVCTSDYDCLYLCLWYEYIQLALKSKSFTASAGHSQIALLLTNICLDLAKNKLCGFFFYPQSLFSLSGGYSQSAPLFT